MFEKNKPDTNVNIVITEYAIGEMKYDSISRRAMVRMWRITPAPFLRHRQ
jgi:hypothetical protein